MCVLGPGVEGEASWETPPPIPRCHVQRSWKLLSPSRTMLASDQSGPLNDRHTLRGAAEDRVTGENVIGDINYVKSAPAAQEDDFNGTVLHCSSAAGLRLHSYTGNQTLNPDGAMVPHTDQLNKLRIVNNGLVRQSVSFYRDSN
ncbi:unnamed protein product [Pleuronectes platessa]|uniref:Uncharacterized protein n=1 Tax=Pleuronectes platessa TaxID=8262 RepID=A0A9N7YDC5_PLEPL|nr:unnamed protein product [Pleuronectes platessa]